MNEKTFHAIGFDWIPAGEGAALPRGHGHLVAPVPDPLTDGIEHRLDKAFREFEEGLEGK